MGQQGRVGLRGILIAVVFLSAIGLGSSGGPIDEWTTEHNPREGDPAFSTLSSATSGTEIAIGEEILSVCADALWDLNRTLFRTRRVVPYSKTKQTVSALVSAPNRFFFGWWRRAAPVENATESETPYAFVQEIDRALAGADSRNDVVNQILRHTLAPERVVSSEQFTRLALTYLAQSSAVQLTDLPLLRELASQFGLEEFHVRAIRETCESIFTDDLDRVSVARAFEQPWGEIHWVVPGKGSFGHLSLAAQHLLASLKRAVDRKRTIADFDEAILPFVEQASDQLDVEDFVRYLIEVVTWDRYHAGASKRIDRYRELLSDVPLVAHQVHRLQQKIFDVWFDPSISSGLRKEVREPILNLPWGRRGITRSAPAQVHAIAARDTALKEGLPLPEVLNAQMAIARERGGSAEAASIRTQLEAMRREFETQFQELQADVGSRIAALEASRDSLQGTNTWLKGELTKVRRALKMIDAEAPATDPDGRSAQ